MELRRSHYHIWLLIVCFRCHKNKTPRLEQVHPCTCSGGRNGLKSAARLHGNVERRIRTIESVMRKLAHDQPRCTPTVVLSLQFMEMMRWIELWAPHQIGGHSERAHRWEMACGMFLVRPWRFVLIEPAMQAENKEAVIVGLFGHVHIVSEANSVRI